MYSWSRSPPLVLVSQGLAVGKDQTKGGILLTLIAEPVWKWFESRMCSYNAVSRDNPMPRATGA